MNITQVMNKLYERNYLDKLHRTIKEGLVGSLRQEYLMQRPLRAPYEKYVAEVNEFVSLPIFHAMVDMMTSNLLHSVSKELVSEVLNTIDELDTLSKPSVVSVEALLTVIKEIRENNCLACEHRFSRTDCILTQVKNGNKCPKEITDEDIAQAIHNLYNKGEPR